jgi:hypothetical protein
MSMRPALLLSLTLLLLGAPLCLWAQDDSEAEAENGTEVGTETGSGDREVEINEENYRRHMELGDVDLQGNNFPVTDYGAQAQLQKLSRLPEASQRHLRDELRDIITQGGPWTPAEAGKTYPFEPSDAARGNSELRRMESEAWEELVSSYHQREAAMDAGRQAGTDPGDDERGEVTQGDGEGGQQPDGQQRDALNLQAMAAATPAPGQRGETSGQASDALSGNPQNADPTPSGSTQSAMEFLSARSPSAAQAEASPESAQDSQDAQDAQDAQDQEQQDQEVIFREDGVLAIRDLEQVRGVVPAAGNGDQAEEEDEEENGEEDGDENP